MHEIWCDRGMISRLNISCAAALAAIKFDWMAVQSRVAFEYSTSPEKLFSSRSRMDVYFAAKAGSE